MNEAADSGAKASNILERTPGKKGTTLLAPRATTYSGWLGFLQCGRATLRPQSAESPVCQNNQTRGLEGVIRFHDLRHIFASLKFLRGAKQKVISEALGHSSVAFTMDTYSHIIEGMQEDARALLDEVLPAGKNGVSQKNNANLTPDLPKVGAYS